MIGSARDTVIAADGRLCNRSTSRLFAIEQASTSDIDLESCLRQVVHGIERGIGTGGDQLTGIKYHHTLTQSHRLAGEPWICVLQLREVE